MKLARAQDEINRNKSGSGESLLSLASRLIPFPSALRLSDLSPRRPASLQFPIRIKGENELNQVLSQISVLSRRAKLDESDWESLRRLVAQAVERMSEQANTDAQFKQLALTDELTGLYNRRGFLVLAMHQLKLCRRNGQGALLFFVDVDGLKRVNDLYGHASGDELLVRCGAALRATFRESDIVARLDGDEFAAFALEEQGQSEQSIRARLKSNVERENAIDRSSWMLSLSIGASRFNPRAPQTLAELLIAADRTMYQQKRERPASRVTILEMAD